VEVRRGGGALTEQPARLCGGHDVWGEACIVAVVVVVEER
jgi:hypothetical protein